MSIINVNIPPQRVQPFMREDNAAAVGQMFGHNRTIGDASGGVVTIGFLLPENNVYLFRWAKAQTSAASDITVDVAIGLGIVTDGATMSWRETGVIVSDGISTSRMFEPERLIVLPDNQPVVSVTYQNVLGRNFDFQFAAVFWSRQAFIDMPSEKFSRFL